MPSADPTPTSTPRVLLVAGADPLAAERDALDAAFAATAGREVLVVAPATAVDGERWIVDLGARAADAHRRADAWARALAPHAASVRGVVGDASPRAAVEDARATFAPDHVLVVAPAPAPASPPRGRRVRVRARARAWVRTAAAVPSR